MKAKMHILAGLHVQRDCAGEPCKEESIPGVKDARAMSDSALYRMLCDVGKGGRGGAGGQCGGCTLCAYGVEYMRRMHGEGAKE